MCGVGVPDRENEKKKGSKAMEMQVPGMSVGVNGMPERQKGDRSRRRGRQGRRKLCDEKCNLSPRPILFECHLYVLS